MKPVHFRALETLLGDLSAEDLLVLREKLQVKKYSPGYAIAHEGSTSDHFFLLTSGRARLSKRRPDGGQEVVAYLGPLTLFGHASALRKVPYLTTSAAVEPSECILIPSSLINRRPSPRLRRVSRRLKEASVLGMTEQLRAVNARLLSMSSIEALDDLASDLGAWSLPQGSS